jgi:hypothetical protein
MKDLGELIQDTMRACAMRDNAMRDNSSRPSPARRREPTSYWMQCRNAVKACRRKDVMGPRKAVLETIVGHMNERSHIAFPSYELIAIESGLSRTAVYNAIKALRASKILIVEKRRMGRPTPRGSTASEVNIYRIDLEQLYRGPMRNDACTRTLDANAESAKLATVRHANGGSPKR